MQNKNKMMLMLLLTAFVVPVLLAKLALEFEYFSKASTNKGQLLTPTIDTSSIYQLADPKWQIVYFHSGQCEQRCQNALYSLSQVWSALGKKRDRVTPVVLYSSNDQLQSQIAKYPALKEQQLLPARLSAASELIEKDTGIYIIDTLNNALLFYPMPVEQKDTVMVARDVLSDLRKLLKLSRIG